MTTKRSQLNGRQREREVEGNDSMTGPKTLTHTSATLQTWRRLRDLRSHKTELILDGNRLDVAGVVAVGRHGLCAAISSDGEVRRRLERSVEALAACLAREWVVYGVNTGFGGSADSRTGSLVELQLRLLQHTQSGLVEGGQAMRPDWVRAAIVVRVNQNLRGHSAVRLSVLQGLIDMLRLELTPMVPLRGSISASGDLMPMSYIAGALAGNPDIKVRLGGVVMPAPEALQRSGLSPSGLGPKEALGLINGTAPSTAVACLVLHDAQRLALLTQLLTSLAAEALGGNVEWALPFVHATRPHAGQVEAAANMRRFLSGSRLVVGLEAVRRRTGHGLWQDRYSTRTAPQWIGPYLEDLMLAQRQLETELNSTSDNPLVDSEAEVAGGSFGDVFSGGNFQATAVTSAMDKTRLALQMLGRIIFSQVTEIISPFTNNGLEANLNAGADDSFTMKGVDVNMAAYMAELAALAHPVSSHVMPAEMHNQGVNSLALLSARRTAEAADLVALMSACHMYVSCQAVELRAQHRRFMHLLRDGLLPDPTCHGALHGLGLAAAADVTRLADVLFPVLERAWYRENGSTWKHRVRHMTEAVTTPVASFLAAEKHECSVSQLASWQRRFDDVMAEAAAKCFHPGPPMPPAEVAAQLGSGTVRLYAWLRSRLGVPLHCGLDHDPLYNARRGLPTDGCKTIGSWISVVYESLRGGALMDMVLDGLETTREQGPRTGDEFERLCRELEKY